MIQLLAYVRGHVGLQVYRHELSVEMWCMRGFSISPERDGSL